MLLLLRSPGGGRGGGRGAQSQNLLLLVSFFRRRLRIPRPLRLRGHHPQRSQRSTGAKSNKLGCTCKYRSSEQSTTCVRLRWTHSENSPPNRRQTTEPRETKRTKTPFTTTTTITITTGDTSQYHPPQPPLRTWKARSGKKNIIQDCCCCFCTDFTYMSVPGKFSAYTCHA